MKGTSKSNIKGQWVYAVTYENVHDNYHYNNFLGVFSTYEDAYAYAKQKSEEPIQGLKDYFKSKGVEANVKDIKPWNFIQDDLSLVGGISCAAEDEFDDWLAIRIYETPIK